MKKKFKKLKLKKSIIANLNKPNMKQILGGETAGCSLSGCNTTCGPRCDTANTCEGCGPTYVECTTFIQTLACC